MNDQFDVIVVGGGIAGLVAGLTAVEAGSRVALVDSHAVGGRAKSVERNGYIYNQGPHALYLAGHLQPFLDARGLSPAGGTPATKTVRLLRGGDLHELTFSPVGLGRTKLLSPSSRVKLLALLAGFARLKTAQFVGTTWSDWLSGQPDDIAGILAMLARTGTYVNAPDSFDAAAALQQAQLALLGVRYLDGGWQAMIESMVARFEATGGTVIAHRTVQSIASDGDVAVETSDGVLRGNAVVVAGLSPDATERVTGGAIRGRDALGAPVHAAALDLALARPHPGVVFGIDEPLYLSAHAPTAKLAPADGGLVSLLRYIPDGEVGDAAADRARLRSLATQAGIEDEAIIDERYLHRLVVAHGFPAAHGGGLRGRPTIDALGQTGVFIAGDWVGGEYQLADASSASGEAAARRAVDHGARTADARAR